MEKITKVPISNTLYLACAGMWFAFGIQKLVKLTEHGGVNLLLLLLFNFSIGILYIYLGRKLKDE